MKVEILIREITDCPKKPRSHRLSLCFRSKLGLPLHAGGIFNVKLRTVACHVFFYEFDGKVRLVVSARTKQKVLCLDVSWIAPDDGGIAFDLLGIFIALRQSGGNYQ